VVAAAAAAESRGACVAVIGPLLEAKASLLDESRVLLSAVNMLALTLALTLGRDGS
jgi:hypothetical protein